MSQLQDGISAADRRAEQVGESMTTSTEQEQRLWDMDVRVRDRNLKAGLLHVDGANGVREHLQNLNDLTHNADVIEVPQPAIGSGKEYAAAESDDGDSLDD